MTVLVDSSAFYALLDSEDPQHHAAKRTLEDLRMAATALVTHEYAVIETIALTQRRLGISVLSALVDDVLPLVETIWVDPELHFAARRELLAAGRRGVSLVDWTSFLVMRHHGITTAFAFDPDFAAQGFELIPTVRE